MKALSIAIAAAALLTLAGCAAGPTAPTGSPTASDTPTATPTPEFDIGPEGGCDPRQLEITVQARPQDSGAGQFYWQLQFSNSSDVDCNLEGNPTIVQLDAAGGQVGAPAGVEYVDGAGTVPLPSGATAYSIIHFSQAGNFDCPLVDVASLRVTIPHRDDSTAVTLPVPSAIQGCDSDQVTFNSGSITATEQPG